MTCHLLCDGWMQKKYGQGEQLRRFHFTCLTCPIRRYHYLGEASGFMKTSSVMLFGESADRQGAETSAATDTTYFLIIKLGTRIDRCKTFLSRELLTVAAKISLWHKPHNGRKCFALLTIPESTVVPVQCTTFFAVLPVMNFLKHQIVKLFVTVAERIAEW